MVAVRHSIFVTKRYPDISTPLPPPAGEPLPAGDNQRTTPEPKVSRPLGGGDRETERLRDEETKRGRD